MSENKVDFYFDLSLITLSFRSSFTLNLLCHFTLSQTFIKICLLQKVLSSLFPTKIEINYSSFELSPTKFQ